MQRQFACPQCYSVAGGAELQRLRVGRHGDDLMNSGLLIFDLDGTLMDTRRDLCTGINLMRRHYGLAPLPVDTVAGYVGNGIRNLVARALQDHQASRERCAQASPVDLDEAVRINYQCYCRHLHDETVLYPGVENGVHQLHAAGYILALISNKPVEACRELLRYFKLAGLFSSVLGGDSVRELKPHPEAVLATLRSTRVDRTRTWMIGDHVTDLEAARRAGIKSVFVSYGIGAPGGEQPTQKFTTFEALTQYFTSISRRNDVRGGTAPLNNLQR